MREIDVAHDESKWQAMDSPEGHPVPQAFLSQGRSRKRLAAQLGFVGAGCLIPPPQVPIPGPQPDMCHAGTGEIARVIANAAFQPQAAAFTSMLSMCAKNREWQKALEVFQAMRDYHPAVRPNTVHYSSLISACATVGRCDEAMQVHALRIDLSNFTIVCCVLFCSPRTALVLASCTHRLCMGRVRMQACDRDQVNALCFTMSACILLPCQAQQAAKPGREPCKLWLQPPRRTFRNALQASMCVLCDARRMQGSGKCLLACRCSCTCRMLPAPTRAACPM